MIGNFKPRNRQLPLKVSKIAPRSRRGSGTPYEFTDEHRHFVQHMRAGGMSVEAIANAMDITIVTLSRRFKTELAIGKDIVDSKMVGMLIQLALAGNVSALKFYMANCMRGFQHSRDEQLLDQPERDDVVHFYLPPNHRDEPEELPPEIEGVAEEAA